MPDKEEAEIWEGSMEEEWEPSNCLVGLGTGEGLLGLSFPDLPWLSLSERAKWSQKAREVGACADLREECRARIPGRQDHIQC